MTLEVVSCIQLGVAENDLKEYYCIGESNV